MLGLKVIGHQYAIVSRHVIIIVTTEVSDNLFVGFRNSEAVDLAEDLELAYVLLFED